jgi:hypothetical protein
MIAGIGGAIMGNRRVEISSDITSTIDMYVASTLKDRHPVSTADAIRAIRLAVPKCELGDRALADLIASSAIRSRQNVIFDALDEPGSGSSI